MAINLDALEKLRAEATPGEWYAKHDYVRANFEGDCYQVAEASAWTDADPRNATYIAALHNALPELIALARDGERYRWLRDMNTGPCKIWKLVSNDFPPQVTLKHGEELDATIDSARGKK